MRGVGARFVYILKSEVDPDRHYVPIVTFTLKRRLFNALAKPLFSDLNRRLGPLLAGTSLVIEHDEPAAFGGAYRLATLISPQAIRSFETAVRR